MDSRRGFTLVELMIAVVVIGVLASIAISTLMAFRFRARVSEATLNLRFLVTLETAYAGAHDSFASARASPPTTPGRLAQDWVDAGDFEPLGWRPEGKLFFQYQISTSADGKSFAAAARSDLDGDGAFQILGVGKKLPNASGEATCPFGGELAGTGGIESLTRGRY
jgi:prepilin-type N-terminal cleavage/methylation domain-containing protein